MLTYTPSKTVKTQDITRLACPQCGEKVQRIVLAKGSKISGLSFKCKRCGNFWNVTTE